MKKLLIIATSFILAGYLSHSMDAKELEKVQSGQVVLVCDTAQHGEHEIKKELVKDFIDGEWIFTNGSATNCYTKGNKE